MNKENNGKRKLWTHPWRYRESFLVVVEIALLGLIFEVLSGGKGAPLLAWPANAVAGAGILGFVAIIYFQSKNHRIVKWLASVPAAISAISFFAFCTLLLGFIKQDGAHDANWVNMLGFSRMKNSWLLMVSGLYFLATLGFVTMRRITPLNRKNIGFLLNHLGLWITIAAGYLGSGDLEKRTMQLMEGHAAMNMVMDRKAQAIDTLPFATRLIDFSIEDYNPKMAVLDAKTGDVILGEGQSMPVIEEGMQLTLLDWDVEVLEFLPDAKFTENGYEPWDSIGSAPAARVRVQETGTEDFHEGWISCGSFMTMFNHMPIDANHYLAMTFPEPQKFASDIIIEDPELGEIEVRLEVNKPFKHRGWKLYQQSYDERMGKWSQVSIIECVRDPWLPVVYLGIFMLLAGSAYLFWTGSTSRDLVKKTE